MHHLLNFKDFNTHNLLNNPEDYVNSYITESLSVSINVQIALNKLLREFNKSKLIKIQPMFIDDYETETYTYEKKPVITILGKLCELDVKFINITNDLTDNEIKTVSRNNCFAYIGLNCVSPDKNPETVMNIYYVLHTDIIMYHMSITKYTESALSHELTHAFVYYKIMDGITVADCEKLDEKNKVWKETYNFCETVITGCNKNPDTNYLGYGKDFFHIVYAIYSCSDDEINAFVQQSYTYTKGSKSINEIKSNLKETDLWDIICNLKECIDLFDNGYRETYIVMRENIGRNLLPKCSVIYSLLKKCYAKSYSSYGKILMKLIDELQEDKLDEQTNNGMFVSYCEKDGPNIKKYFI